MALPLGNIWYLPHSHKPVVNSAMHFIHTAARGAGNFVLFSLDVSFINYTLMFSTIHFAYPFSLATKYRHSTQNLPSFHLPLKLPSYCFTSYPSENT